MCWDRWLEEYNELTECSTAALASAYDSRDKKRIDRIEKNIKLNKRSMDAVKSAYYKNPKASKAELLKIATKEVTKSVVLSLILTALFYTAISKAISWFIDRLWESKSNT